MVGKLVAGVDNGTHYRRVALGNAAGNEKSGVNLPPLQDLQNQRHTDPGAIGALGEHPGTRGVRRVLRYPDLFGVEVKGDGRRGLGASRPAVRARGLWLVHGLQPGAEQGAKWALPGLDAWHIRYHTYHLKYLFWRVLGSRPGMSPAIVPAWTALLDPGDLAQCRRGSGTWLRPASRWNSQMKSSKLRPTESR